MNIYCKSGAMPFIRSFLKYLFAADIALMSAGPIQAQTKVRQISGGIKATDPDMLPYDESILTLADLQTEHLPGTFETVLYAASLYDILRANCHDGTSHPDMRQA